MFHNSLHDRYEARPVTTKGDEEDWDCMTLADFVSNYDIVYKPGNRKNVIKLQNKKGFIAKRGSPCVLRYFLRYTNEEEMYRALCILFHPFRNEMKDIHSSDVKSLYLEHEEHIEENRLKYEKHRGLVEIIKKVEEAKENDDDEENEENEPDDYITEETTEPADIASFEKESRAKAVKALNTFNVGMEMMPEDDYLRAIKSLNTEQQRIFYDFCERMSDRTSDKEPFYCYISGEAGTGKSFLMKLMIDFMKRMAKQSGTELHKPLHITVAPTGVAAWIIGGDTIESALAIQPNTRRAHLRASSSQNSNLQFLYENLQVMFLDEVSMVGSNHFKKMDFRMQDIMMNSKFMGGVSMIISGDFGQLPPVGQQIIWGRCNLDGRPEMASNEWDDHVKIYKLKEKMRSQDPEYSKVCDKVRLGLCDAEIIKYMKGHITKSPNLDNNEMYAKGKLSIIVTTNAEREKINTKMLNSLLPHKKSYTVSSVDEATNVRNPPPLAKRLPIGKTGQLETQIIFKEGETFQILLSYFNLKTKCFRGSSDDNI